MKHAAAARTQFYCVPALCMPSVFQVCHLFSRVSTLTYNTLELTKPRVNTPLVIRSQMATLFQYSAAD